MPKAVIVEMGTVDAYCNHCLNDGYMIRQPCIVFVMLDLFAVEQLQQTAICACGEHKELILKGGVKLD